jgi:4-aminobutyrate aminotransferase-like enzyme/Ser/Thr protein kinase RdoA (MazF antagonist)
LVAVSPPIPHAEAAELLRRHWGLTGELTELGSFEDQNFAVRDEDGEARYVLKVHGPERSVSLELEHEILRGLAESELAYDVPLPVPTATGDETVKHGPDRVRLLGWVPGTPLADAPDLHPGWLRALGEMAARTGSAMAELAPIVPATDCKWDPRRAAEVVAGVLADDPCPDDEQAAVLQQALAPLAHVDAAHLPRQLIHCDITDVNTLVTGGALTGLIDFGDVTDTWRVSDLAVSCHAVVARHADDAVQAILDVVGGYHDAAPLSEAEADALWPLILARAATCAALSTRHLRLNPGSSYLAGAHAADWLAITTLQALPPDLPTAAVRVVAGRAPLASDPWERVLGALDADPQTYPVLAGLHPRPIDLSVSTDALHEGSWSDPRRLVDAVRHHRATIGRWAEVRLTAAGEPGSTPPATLHLGADVFAPAGTHVRAPLESRVAAVTASEMTLALEDPGYIRLHGIESIVDAGTLVPAGTIVGHVAERTDGGPTRVHVQLATSPGQPGLGDPRRATEWLALCPDPSSLIGADVSAPPPADPRRDSVRRATVVAGAQRLYYAEPVEMVRGWRQRLYDSDGRPYLDMVNNVAAVGHSHPGVAAAAARQLRLLNTNSRFLYRSMADYAERLTDLLPEGLDRVFLVNSGSEACDLALQLARVFTGRRDVIALAGAYHGWTGAVYELCTAPGDNPRWRETKPGYVHVAEQPDPYRGRHGEDADAYARSVARACEDARANGGVAAFISEPMLGNQGAVQPPAGYLQQAYAAVRAAGGVCIADEIQVGLARTGATFWAFEHEGAVPDVVTVAKAAGNGHPVGAVICRRQIAEAFGERASFFSSPGGGPVSCEVGIAVLDAIGAERLQENAAVIGAQLKRDLRALADRHPAIGAVHGRGLYQGIDLVTDRQSKAPDRPLARAVCERMRRLGVIVQPTGDAGNVLKVKPPLCLSADDAAMFVATLDRALGDTA